MSVNLLPGLPSFLTQPALLAAVPGFGPTTGGNIVLLIGANFTGVTSVTFGGTPATILNADPSGFLITVAAPPHTAGNVPVVVTTAAGASSPANYTYLNPPQPPPPTVVGITPQTGPTQGGTPFTIIGTNLTGASVTFGGVPATNVNVIGGVLLTGLTPSGAAGNVAVQVTTPAGSANVTGGFTYTTPAMPTVNFILPTRGPAAGGTPFLINGSNLAGAQVTFGGVPASNIVVDPSGSLVAGITPAGAVGNAELVVTTSAGSVTVTGGFTYE
ncbi:IPT/TIG domain-containing protein [Streptomyces nigra]|uniref:IPT/TIG domain-containing protein n=1 Tax=Streptomyces nigra TaxID=1827580 RepID=UPI0037D5AA22